jgi:hypothetical protein
VIGLQNAAEVSGLKTAVQGFSSVDNFAQYHVLAKLAPALSEIFASDDSEFARLFAAYMTGQSNTSSKPSPPKSDATAAAPVKTTTPDGGSDDK